MAEKRVIEVEVKENFKQVEKDLDNLNESLKETANSSRDVNKTFEEVYGDLQPLTTRLGEAEDRLYELAAAGQTTTQEYKDLLKTVAEYRKIQINTDMVVDAASTTMSTKMTNAIGGVANAFSIAEGASALMGVESEKLQETMVKLQAAMAISQGIQGLKEGGLAFKQLGQSAMTALKGIRTGLAATGIGLFVVALGTVVAYWDDIKAAVSGVSEEQKKLNKQAEKNAQTSKEQYDNLQLQENSLRLQGKSEKEILKIRIDKLNTTIKDEEARIKGLEETSKLEIAAAKRNQEITKMIIQGALNLSAIGLRLLVAPIDMVLETANLVSEKLGFGKITATNLNKEISKLIDVGADIGSKFLFDPAETKAESEATIKEAKKGLEQMKSDRDGFLIQIKESNKQEIDNAKNAKKDEADAKLAAEKEYNEKLRAYYDALEQERQSKITDAKEKELQEIDNKYEQLYEKADAANQNDKELIKKHQEEVIAINQKYALIEAEMIAKAKSEADKLRIQQEEQFQAQIEEIDESNFQARLQKSMTAQEYELELVRQKYFGLEEAAKGNAEQLAIIEEAKQAEIDKINQTYAEKELERKKRNKDFAIESVQSTLSIISNITELFGKKSEKAARKAFQIQKAANIATALVTTYQNATAAYASQFLPIPEISSPIRGGVAAGLAIASGLANVAKIASQKFEGGGTGGGGGSAPSGAGGGGGGAMVAPNFNVIGSSGVNQLAQIQQQPTRAYVVSGDVANGLSLERNRLQNASF